MSNILHFLRARYFTSNDIERNLQAEHLDLKTRNKFKKVIQFL
uniref:Uncharacterized protein n=1 Tax=Lepeophtheirus salmonis TaxID=72036 RepID=A0A0K2TK05_LEPSM